MGKKKAASTPADFPCANAGCLVTGRDKVNKWFAGCGAWYAVPEAALGLARRQPQGPLQTGAAEARGGAAAMAAAAGVQGNAGDDPAHPCPICLEYSQDHAEAAQMY